MIFDQNTVAIGVFSFLGQTSIIELKIPRDCKGRTFDQIIFVQDIPVESQPEWYETAFIVTLPSNRDDRITRLKR